MGKLLIKDIWLDFQCSNTKCDYAYNLTDPNRMLIALDYVATAVQMNNNEEPCPLCKSKVDIVKTIYKIVKIPTFNVSIEKCKIIAVHWFCKKCGSMIDYDDYPATAGQGLLTTLKIRTEKLQRLGCDCKDPDIDRCARVMYI